MFLKFEYEIWFNWEFWFFRFRENGLVFGGGTLYEGREFEVVEKVVEGDGEKRSFLSIVFWERV